MIFYPLEHIFSLIKLDAMEVILGRRSIRKFTSETIPEADVKKLLEAAMSAPSACNQQPWPLL